MKYSYSGANQIPKSTNTLEQYATAYKEYKKFITRHGLDDSSELAAVYYNARAHNLIDDDVNHTFDYIEDYRMWQELSRSHYDDALKSVKSLIAMEK